MQIPLQPKLSQLQWVSFGWRVFLMRPNPWATTFVRVHEDHCRVCIETLNKYVSPHVFNHQWHFVYVWCQVLCQESGHLSWFCHVDAGLSCLTLIRHTVIKRHVLNDPSDSMAGWTCRQQLIDALTTSIRVLLPWVELFLGCPVQAQRFLQTSHD